MPAESEAQKTMACMAYAYKRHGESAIKSVKDKAAVIKMANSMSEEDLKDYCLGSVKK
jgi:hypothetical protein